MSEQPLYLAAAAAWLPPPMELTTLAGQGADEFVTNGIVSIPVAGPDDAPPVMAARAAQTALARAAALHQQDDVVLVLYANTYHQGQNSFWSPASYVQRSAGVSGAAAINVGQASNGGMAALDLAAGYLSARGSGAALITAADRFCEPGIVRWAADYGAVYGDGAAAVVVSTSGGFARIVSVHTSTDAELEQMHRGNTRFQPAPTGALVDVRLSKVQFITDFGLDNLLHRLSTGMRSVVDAALTRAGCDLADMAVVVLPNLNRKMLTDQYLEPLALDPDRTLVEWSSRVGHLGAADQLAGVAHLVESGRVARGDRVLLVGTGSGLSWSAAVLEILDVPVWAERTAEPAPVPVG
ncbi:ketoacyl-ACP synthase III family protein [Dactylosporangium sp. NPDC049525]|uniref:ketoacyl-ACP synthase III family protein n=1 Tax=Dactylosporangium sp. NPDC049525 TaxID=3154730 RepID=UPI0034370F87